MARLLGGRLNGTSAEDSLANFSNRERRLLTAGEGVVSMSGVD